MENVKNNQLDFWFGILDDVRESGAMNMFAAPKWLQENFDLTKQEAREIVTAWMKQF